MTLRQRQPRVEDPAWLAIVRKMPCLICGRGPSDPAHIRAAAPQYGKRYTGKAEKPSDCWVLPLCRQHHDAQHRESELGWWLSMGIPDPFAVAMQLYATRPSPHVERPRKAKPIMRKAKPERKPIFTRVREWAKRKLKSRSTFQTGRKILQRKSETL